MSTNRTMAAGLRTTFESGPQASPPPGDASLMSRPDRTPAQAQQLLADMEIVTEEHFPTRMQVGACQNR